VLPQLAFVLLKQSLWLIVIHLKEVIKDFLKLVLTHNHVIIDPHTQQDHLMRHGQQMYPTIHHWSQQPVKQDLKEDV